MSDPTLEDLRVHLMDHYQDLQQLQFRLTGIMRQIMTSYHALDEIIGEGVNTKGPKRLGISRKRLRELIRNEKDLPVEVGSPFSLDMGPGRSAAPFLSDDEDTSDE